MSEIFGMIKTLLDAHTMGIYSAAALLKNCGYQVIISPIQIENALDKISLESSQQLILKWIKENNINHLGISYRLDPQDAINIVGKLIWLLKKYGYYECDSAVIKSIYFAGLKAACDQIDIEYKGRVKTFKGGESPEETLLIMGVPKDNIPRNIIEGCKYDKDLIKFGKDVIENGNYISEKPLEINKYPEFGTNQDTLIKRLDYNFKNGFQALIRAHLGPYSPDLTRVQCLHQYQNWCKELANAGYLDILSIGSSQLSQSNFGENWDEKINGGGVPVNSEQEYQDIWNASRPMLVRTYSGTKNIELLAKIYEKNINISWHALSLWWFNELDGRGPNSLYKNLKEHVSTIKYIAKTRKPVEANVSHHFAFRGCDDITYIVSAYLAAKVMKKNGIKTFVLQNMLNTPRSTWGIVDLAKSRALLSIIKDLEDNNFRIIFQTRAGLDYFKPSLTEAKIQLAAVSAMMDDIDSNNIYNPEIIHVVSYCEALFLATPEILNESIKITRYALKKYRNLKRLGQTPNVYTNEIITKTNELKFSAKKIIQVMEKNIKDLYSPEGLYIAFISGWLPVPELWSDSDEFKYAKNWATRNYNGGISLIEHENLMNLETRINKCVSNIPEAEYILKNKYF